MNVSRIAMQVRSHPDAPRREREEEEEVVKGEADHVLRQITFSDRLTDIFSVSIVTV
jgi:hypothetical protein